MSNPLFEEFNEANNIFSKETRVIKNMSKTKKIIIKIFYFILMSIHISIF